MSSDPLQDDRERIERILFAVQDKHKEELLAQATVRVTKP
jgi:hypothetical protein